ncbi:MAG: hypothetical protein Tsb0014_43910 [Pleurocapsa sp.]
MRLVRLLNLGLWGIKTFDERELVLEYGGLIQNIRQTLLAPLYSMLHNKRGQNKVSSQIY